MAANTKKTSSDEKKPDPPKPFLRWAGELLVIKAVEDPTFVGRIWDSVRTTDLSGITSWFSSLNNTAEPNNGAFSQEALDASNRKLREKKMRTTLRKIGRRRTQAKKSFWKKYLLTALTLLIAMFFFLDTFVNRFPEKTKHVATTNTYKDALDTYKGPVYRGEIKRTRLQVMLILQVVEACKEKAEKTKVSCDQNLTMDEEACEVEFKHSVDACNAKTKELF